MEIIERIRKPRKFSINIVRVWLNCILFSIICYIEGPLRKRFTLLYNSLLKFVAHIQGFFLISSYAKVMVEYRKSFFRSPFWKDCDIEFGKKHPSKAHVDIFFCTLQNRLAMYLHIHIIHLWYMVSSLRLIDFCNSFLMVYKLTVNMYLCT